MNCGDIIVFGTPRQGEDNRWQLAFFGGMSFQHFSTKIKLEYLWIFFPNIFLTNFSIKKNFIKFLILQKWKRMVTIIAPLSFQHLLCNYYFSLFLTLAIKKICSLKSYSWDGGKKMLSNFAILSTIATTKCKL